MKQTDVYAPSLVSSIIVIIILPDDTAAVKVFTNISNLLLTSSGHYFP